VAIEVLNEPTHMCHLPPAHGYPLGTDIQCWEQITGGRWGGACGRKYTRSRTFWGHRPVWRDYDFGW